MSRETGRLYLSAPPRIPVLYHAIKCSRRRAAPMHACMHAPHMLCVGVRRAGVRAASHRNRASHRSHLDHASSPPPRIARIPAIDRSHAFIAARLRRGDRSRCAHACGRCCQRRRADDPTTRTYRAATTTVRGGSLNYLYSKPTLSERPRARHVDELAVAVALDGDYDRMHRG